MRYLTTQVAGGKLGTDFPYGTLIVNLIGALLIGILVEYLALKGEAARIWRLFLVTGCLGGYTTFSAFSLETTLMMQRGDYTQAAVYVGASIIGTVLLVMLGTFLVRQI
jgi:CrcB protein